jgi:hypothetical protein
VEDPSAFPHHWAITLAPPACQPRPRTFSAAPATAVEL